MWTGRKVMIAGIEKLVTKREDQTRCHRHRPVSHAAHRMATPPVYNQQIGKRRWNQRGSIQRRDERKHDMLKYTRKDAHFSYSWHVESNNVVTSCFFIFLNGQCCRSNTELNAVHICTYSKFGPTTCQDFLTLHLTPPWVRCSFHYNEKLEKTFLPD